MKPIRILITDDSPIMTEQLCEIIEDDPQLEVVGIAQNGKVAVSKVHELRPDLITMDIHMPVMDGLEAIKLIMSQQPTPILVLTDDCSRSTSFEALNRGAMDLIQKPRLLDLTEEQEDKFLRRLKLMASIEPVRHIGGRRSSSDVPAKDIRVCRRSLVAIGGSTGGPRALMKVLSGLPGNFNAAILIVQHMSHGFSQGLANWLDSASSLPVRLATDGAAIETGVVLVAPDDVHMVATSARRIALQDTAPYDGHRPSVTKLFKSVARSFGSETVGLLLSGMGSDGAQGLLDIRKAGGATVAQDKESSVVFGMSRAAIELNAVQQVLDIEKVASTLVQTVGES